MNEEIINHLRSRGFEPTANDIEVFNRIFGNELEATAKDMAWITDDECDKQGDPRGAECVSMTNNLIVRAKKYKSYKYEAHKNVINQ